MTKETAIKRQIKDYLNYKKYLWWWNLQGLGAKPGLPDLMVLGADGQLYMIEVKSPVRGKLSMHQLEFLNEAKRNGAKVIVARKSEDVTDIL